MVADCNNADIDADDDNDDDTVYVSMYLCINLHIFTYLPIYLQVLNSYSTTFPRLIESNLLSVWECVYFVMLLLFLS